MKTRHQIMQRNRVFFLLWLHIFWVWYDDDEAYNYFFPHLFTKSSPSRRPLVISRKNNTECLCSMPQTKFDVEIYARIHNMIINRLPPGLRLPAVQYMWTQSGGKKRVQKRQRLLIIPNPFRKIILDRLMCMRWAILARLFAKVTFKLFNWINWYEIWARVCVYARAVKAERHFVQKWHFCSIYWFVYDNSDFRKISIRVECCYCTQKQEGHLI